MSTIDTLETKIREVVKQLQKHREENKCLVKENKQLESQSRLLEEENIKARKLISQNNMLMTKHKKIKERIQRLWGNISQAI